jgi:hypothetical protein
LKLIFYTKVSNQLHELKAKEKQKKKKKKKKKTKIITIQLQSDGLMLPDPSHKFEYQGLVLVESLRALLLLRRLQFGSLGR